MISPHAFLETADAFAQAAHHFGNLATPKEQHNHQKNNQPMDRKSLTHKISLNSFPAALTVLQIKPRYQFSRVNSRGCYLTV